MRHLIWMGLGVLASLLAASPASAGLLRLDKYTLPGGALGPGQRLEQPDWLESDHNAIRKALGGAPSPQADPRILEANAEANSPNWQVDKKFAAWRKEVLLQRCGPGALFLVAAAAVTWDHLVLSKLPTRRRSRRRLLPGWKKALIATLVALGLFLLAAPLLQSWLARGLFLLAVALLLSLCDPFKSAAENWHNRRLKQLGLAASLAMLTLLPGFGLPSFPGTNTPATFENSVAEAQQPKPLPDERLNVFARFAPDDMAELEPNGTGQLDLVSTELQFIPERDAGPRKPSGLLRAMHQGEDSAHRLWGNLNWPNAGTSRGVESSRLGQLGAQQSSSQSLLQVQPFRGNGRRSGAGNSPGQPSDRLPQPGEVSPVDIGGSLVAANPLPANTVGLLPERGAGEDDDQETTLPDLPTTPSLGGDGGQTPTVVDNTPGPWLPPNDGGGTPVTLDPAGPAPPDQAVLVAPEPGSLVLLGVGAFGLLGFRMRNGLRRSRAGR